GTWAMRKREVPRVLRLVRRRGMGPAGPGPKNPYMANSPEASGVRGRHGARPHASVAAARVREMGPDPPRGSLLRLLTRRWEHSEHALSPLGLSHAVVRSWV